MFACTLSVPAAAQDDDPPPPSGDVATESVVEVETVKPAEKPTLLVFKFTGNDVSEGVIRAATDFAASAFGATGRFDMMTMADIETLVELEESKQAMGCDEAGCMAEIAGAVGADFVATGEINAIGEIYAIKLSLLRPEDASLVGIETLRVRRLESVPELMDRSATRLAYTAFGEPIPKKLKNRRLSRARRPVAKEEEGEPNFIGTVIKYSGAGTFGAMTLVGLAGTVALVGSMYFIYTATTPGWQKLYGRYAATVGLNVVIISLFVGMLGGGGAVLGWVLE